MEDKRKRGNDFDNKTVFSLSFWLQVLFYILCIAVYEDQLYRLLHGCLASQITHIRYLQRCNKIHDFFLQKRSQKTKVSYQIQIESLS